MKHKGVVEFEAEVRLNGSGEVVRVIDGCMTGEPILPGLPAPYTTNFAAFFPVEPGWRRALVQYHTLVRPAVGGEAVPAGDRSVIEGATHLDVVETVVPEDHVVVGYEFTIEDVEVARAAG